MDKIILNLALPFYVGVLKKERAEPQNLNIYIEIFSDFQDAAMNDDINDTINYSEIKNLITKISENNKYNLLETLAQRIAYDILEYPRAEKVLIRISKVNKNFASIEITRKQNV